MSTDDDDNKEPRRISLLPKSSVLTLSSIERATARIHHLELMSEPPDDGSADLARDTFFALFKSEPKVRDAVSDDRSINKAVLDMIMNDGSIEGLRSETAQKIIGSLVAAPALYESLASSETIKKALEKQKEIEEANKKIAEEMKKAAQENDQKMLQNLQAQADAMKAQAAQCAADLKKKTKSNPFFKAAVNHAVKSAGEKAAAANDFADQYGINAGNESASMSAADVQAILDNIKRQTDAAKIAEMVGRLKGFAAKKIEEAKSHRTSAAVRATIINDDPLMLFPDHQTDVMDFTNPLVQRVSIARFLEGLPGWETIEQNEKQGHFYACVDASGSMSGYPNIIAKSMALALAQAAMETDNRKWWLSSFSSDPDDLRFVSSQDDWQKVVNWATEFQGGGTDFTAPLEAALGMIEAHPEHGVIDILLITDGYGNVEDGIVQRLVDSKVRLFILAINSGDGVNEELDKIAYKKLVVRWRYGSNSFEAIDHVEAVVQEIANMIGEEETVGD